MSKVEEIINSGFHKKLGMSIVEETETSVTLRVNLSDESYNPFMTAHGGLIFTLADTAMGITAGLTGKLGVTLDSNINYLKPCTGAYITADAQIVRCGRTTCVVRSNIYNDKNDLCAIAQATYYFVK